MLQHFCNLQVRDWADLPENAKKYVQRIQELVGIECRWIGVGPGRDALVVQPSGMQISGAQKSQEGMPMIAS